MVEWMIRNPHQENLAERSLEVNPAEEGEYWKFYWFMDPIVSGLAESYRFYAHVSPEGQVSMIGMWVATNERESLAQEQAIQFVKDRFERYGLDAEDTEGGN